MANLKTKMKFSKLDFSSYRSKMERQNKRSPTYKRIY